MHSILIAALIPFAFARNCTPGIKYCGKTLLDIGNYQQQVTQALKDAGQPSDDAHTQASLFNCIGGSNGDIKFISYCDFACKDGGAGQDDSCVKGRDCTEGLSYCGQTLLGIGEYTDRINKALGDAKQTADALHIQQGLYDCGKNGDVTFNNFCVDGCHDGGAGKSDSCNAVSGRCTEGLNYCGKTLLNKGRYRDQISSALRAANQPDSEFYATSGLFSCLGGKNGDVKFEQLCFADCLDGGAGKSDTCQKEECPSKCRRNIAP